MPPPSNRSFGLTVGVVCAAAGMFRLWRGQEVSGSVLAAIGGVLIAAGLVAPTTLRVANRVWMRIAHVLGWINSRVLLTAFFFLVLTPAGVIMRLFGRSPLQARAASTNWSAYSLRRRDPKHYERMF
jgi:Saxitoxin biosynthesis operon protein SxtJ